MRNHEITQRRRLLDEDGNVAEAGYARSLLLDYSRADIRTARHRIKEWDYYLVSNNSDAVALTVADNGYIGLLSASMLSLDPPKDITNTHLDFFPLGKYNMPSTSRSGDVLVSNKRCRFSYRHEGDRRVLEAEFKRLDKLSDFSCKFVLSDPPRDSMVIATPFNKRGHFYYNQKINCMRAEGEAQLGAKTVVFSPDTAVGMLDWGRGVWTYSNTWYWATASGYVDGEPFGLNLGYGFGDTSAASENMIFYKGIAHKLDDVDFGIPRLASGRYDLMSPWHFTSSDKRLEIDFQPILDRKAYMSMLIVSTDQHQIFGNMSGYAVLDDGSTVRFSGLKGSAEVVKNRA